MDCPKCKEKDISILKSNSIETIWFCRICGHQTSGKIDSIISEKYEEKEDDERDEFDLR